MSHLNWKRESSQMLVNREKLTRGCVPPLFTGLQRIILNRTHINYLCSCDLMIMICKLKKQLGENEKNVSFTKITINRMRSLLLRRSHIECCVLDSIQYRWFNVHVHYSEIVAKCILSICLEFRLMAVAIIACIETPLVFKCVIPFQAKSLPVKRGNTRWTNAYSTLNVRYQTTKRLRVIRIPNNPIPPKLSILRLNIIPIKNIIQLSMFPANTLVEPWSTT